MNDPVTTTEEYIATFPADVQPVLSDVAAAMRRALPGAEERIRYGMPAVVLGGRYALHFAGWKHHVGIYPVPAHDPGPRGRGGPLPGTEGHPEVPVPGPDPVRPHRAPGHGPGPPAPLTEPSQIDLVGANARPADQHAFVGTITWRPDSKVRSMSWPGARG